MPGPNARQWYNSQSTAEATTQPGSSTRKALEAYNSDAGIDVNSTVGREQHRLLKTYFGADSKVGRALSIFAGR